jgi:predicted AlkP superfamily phosphohydrolase/phosphomutase
MLKSWVETISRYQDIDWAESIAFADSRRETIRLNLKGREPMGIVDSDKYGAVRDKIIERLKQFKDPETGETIYSEIYCKEDIYWGPYTDRAPDIVCLQTGRKYLYSVSYFTNSAFSHKESIKAYSQKTLMHDISPNADHSPEGIIIALGKNIKQGNTLDRADITDIAPTVLYLMGLPIPSDMDGKVLRDIFSDSFLRENRIEYKEVEPQQKLKKDDVGYSKEEEEEFKKSLKDLGYL